MSPLSRTASGVGAGIYAPHASARTYRHLEALAAAALRAGLPAIVDATNLRREDRARFIAVARAARCPAAIVWCQADEATIARRMRQRETEGGDPSEATLEVAAVQQSMLEPPDVREAELLTMASSGDERCEDVVTAIRGLVAVGARDQRPRAR